MVPGFIFWRSVRNVLQPQLNLGFVKLHRQTHDFGRLAHYSVLEVSIPVLPVLGKQ